MDDVRIAHMLYGVVNRQMRRICRRLDSNVADRRARHTRRELVRLLDQWQDLDTGQRIAAIQALCDLLVELARIECKIHARG